MTSIGKNTLLPEPLLPNTLLRFGNAVLSGRAAADPLHRCEVCDMGGRFIRPALTVDVTTKHFPFEYGFLEGPAYFDIPPLRVIYHELTHFWQTLSMNYLSNVALGDWLSMLDYEKDGQITTSRTLTSRQLNTKNEVAGFSPNDLLESLSRFWDVHVMGPKKIAAWSGLRVDYNIASRYDKTMLPADPVEAYTGDEFDKVMLSETYSAPYKLIHDKLGSYKAAVAFPIVAYFSFQSRSPAQVYLAALDSVEKAIRLSSDGSIHTAWRESFISLANHVTSAGFNAGSPLSLAHSVFPTLARRQNAANSNPLFVHYGKLLVLVEAVSSRQELDFTFALPGDTEARGLLIGRFLPPLVCFIDGRWALKSLLQSKVADHEELSDTAQDIRDRYGKFQFAAYLQGPGPAKG